MIFTSYFPLQESSGQFQQSQRHGCNPHGWRFHRRRRYILHPHGGLRCGAGGFGGSTASGSRRGRGVRPKRNTSYSCGVGADVASQDLGAGAEGDICTLDISRQLISILRNGVVRDDLDRVVCPLTLYNELPVSEI